MLEIAYGVRVASLDDELVKVAERATVETVLAGSPGSMLVDFFPIRASSHFADDYLVVDEGWQ